MVKMHIPLRVSSFHEENSILYLLSLHNIIQGIIIIQLNLNTNIFFFCSGKHELRETFLNNRSAESDKCQP